MAERGRIRTSDTVACVPHRSAVALGHSATSPRGFAPPFSRSIADHAMRGKRWVAYCGKTVGGEGRVSNPRAPWALPAGALDQLGHPLLFLVAHALFVAATGTNNSRVRATAGPKNFRLRGWPIVPRFGARRGIRASAPLSFTTAPSSRQSGRTICIAPSIIASYGFATSPRNIVPQRSHAVGRAGPRLVVGRGWSGGCASQDQGTPA